MGPLLRGGAAAWQARIARPAGALWAAYCNQLVQRPLLSRCLTGVVGAVLSDATAQLGHRAAEQHRRRRKGRDAEGSNAPPLRWQYDWMRTARLALYSFAIATPIAHRWFTFLDTVRVGP